MPKIELKTHQINFVYWLILTTIIFVIFFIKLLTGLNVEQYANVVVTLIPAGFIGLILTPLIMNIVGQIE